MGHTSNIPEGISPLFFISHYTALPYPIHISYIPMGSISDVPMGHGKYEWDMGMGYNGIWVIFPILQ